jgi:hypothetical protein
MNTRYQYNERYKIKLTINYKLYTNVVPLQPMRGAPCRIRFADTTCNTTNFTTQFRNSVVFEFKTYPKCSKLTLNDISPKTNMYPVRNHKLFSTLQNIPVLNLVSSGLGLYSVLYVHYSISDKDIRLSFHGRI